MHILLTGASRGIGAATLDALSAAGHRVAGQSTAGDGDLLAADFTDPDAPRRLWEKAFDRLENPGIVDQDIDPAVEAVDDNAADGEWHAAWARTMQVNLQSSADLCRLAIATWRGAGTGGRIVNVASRAAYRGDSPKHWHYAASKAGMIGMTKSIARGYAAENILAFAVCPGFTASDMVGDYLESRGGAKLLADIPLGRVATPQEIAEVIRWLACDAPASATGAVIDANGASYVR